MTLKLPFGATEYMNMLIVENGYLNKYRNLQVGYLHTVQTNLIHVYVIQEYQPGICYPDFPFFRNVAAYVTRVYRPGMRGFPSTLLSALVRVETNKRPSIHWFIQYR